MTLDRFNYSEKYNCFWIAPPRTGTRGLCQILNFLGFHHKTKPLMLIPSFNFTHELPPPEIVGNSETLISVRNPYGRLFSIYKNFFFLGKKTTFEDYVKNIFPTHLNHHVFGYFHFKPTYFVRLENQYDDLQKIPFVKKTFKDNQLKLLTSHSKELDNWEVEYTEEMKDIVFKYLKNQFEMFGYEK